MQKYFAYVKVPCQITEVQVSQLDFNPDAHELLIQEIEQALKKDCLLMHPVDNLSNIIHLIGCMKIREVIDLIPQYDYFLQSLCKKIKINEDDGLFHELLNIDEDCQDLTKDRQILITMMIQLIEKLYFTDNGLDRTKLLGTAIVEDKSSENSFDGILENLFNKKIVYVMSSMAWNRQARQEIKMKNLNFYQNKPACLIQIHKLPPMRVSYQCDLYCLFERNESKPPVHQDDSECSSYYQVDSFSQQCDISIEYHQKTSLIDFCPIKVVDMIDKTLIVNQVNDVIIKSNKPLRSLEKQNKKQRLVTKSTFCPYQVKASKQKSQNLIHIPSDVTILDEVKFKTVDSGQQKENQQFKKLLPQIICDKINIQGTQQTLPPPSKINQIKLRKKKPNQRIKQQIKITQNKDHSCSYKPEHMVQVDFLTKLMFESRIQEEIQNFSSDIRSQQDKYKLSREIVFKRIQSIVRSLFPYSDAGIFGSCATGLALPDSDIDISISGFEMYPRASLFQPMKYLLEILSQFSWVVKFKHIYSASVPILKLEIDPSITFYTQTYQPIQIDQAYRMNFDTSKAPCNQYYIYINKARIFQVDISFDTIIPETRFNVAYQSTNMIIHWTRIYPGFSEITIILKYLLKKKNLNDAFSGGISSYCMAVMLAAVYKSNQNSQGLCMLEQFLYKYGMDFDPKDTVVSLSEYSGFSIQNERSTTTYPLTVYSPITNQVISGSAISAPEILQVYEKFYLALMAIKKNLKLQICKFFPPEKLNEIIQKKWPIRDILKYLPIEQEFIQIYLNSQ